MRIAEMGVGLSEIEIEIKKCVIFTIRCCFRSVCNHPFLVGNLCFLIFLYRSFPFIFSLLVSASPVLICTAILLGTILSFGQPNIPEIEIEEKTTRGSVPIETGISKDNTVVDRNESHYNAGRYSDVKGGRAEWLGNGSGESIPNVEEESGEIELGDSEIWEDTIDEQKSDNDWNEERLRGDGEDVENPYSPILRADDESNELDAMDSFNSEMVNVASLNFPHSPWKHVRNEEDKDDISDSGSDGAESSSPDASMADIMPMLDELHPLLDEDSSNHIQISYSVSGIVSERSSSRPSTSSHESADEIENCDDFEVEEDDNEDDDGQVDKDEGTKPAITWTEEDQKNLMDLGSSEIERNQRLENLILRRRKNVSMVPEINLIDLESSDFPPHVTSISTSRQNPFDDTYDNNIPGSAPSILLQRRNPFEISYESSQEKGNPLGDDGFQEQLSFFKRHESFNVGPSVFAPNRQDVKMRPYFVPERMISEESIFSPFNRQSSELSDSKTSSIPEMESVGSVEDFEDRKILEDDHSPQELLLDVMSRTDEEVTVEGPLEEDPEMITKKELSGEDVINEPQLISEMNHVSEHIGHGSQSSSEDEESLEFKKSYSRGSSSSLMSEASERTFTEIDEKKDGTTFVENCKYPVYDTSPHAESNQILPPVLVKRMVSFAERDSENREIGKGITSDAVSCVEASKVEVLVDDNTKNFGRSDDGEKRLMIDGRENVVSPNSDGDYQEAYERLTSTPSGGGSTSHFYNIAMHEPNFEHLEEVPVPNTPVESSEKMRTIQNLNIPEIYEFDHDTSSSVGSPFSPDFISMPSSASSHDDMHTIHEEVDEIKEIDEKHIVDSVGETSTMHETGHESDKHEENTECESEIDEMDSHDFTVKETYEEVSKKDESTSTSQVHTDTTSGMPELEPSKKSLDGVLEKDLKPNSDDGSVEVEAEKIHLSSGEESGVNKPYHEVKAPEDLEFTFTASVKWKGNKSESTSSSSSSSSSDSDGE